MAKTLMAVDAGTGSVRAVLFSLDGEQLGCVQQEWTHKEDPRFPGSMDFDWTTNWDLARNCIRGVIEQTGVDPKDIAAVSTTCMREGIVLYDKDGNEIFNKEIYNFECPGVLQGQYNKDSSIKSFAHSCFNYAINTNQDLWFATKDTISKQYDQTFKLLFQEIYEECYKAKFEELGIEYFYTLIDDAVARVIRSEGGYIWACKNYDGDVMSDMVSTAFGSLAMMTSVLVSPDGKYEYEAAHGTVTRHYYRYLKGEETSTNPMATIFAWSGALRKRGELDGLSDLVAFADKLESACIDTLNDGIMTKDLVGLVEPGVSATAVNTVDFIKAIRARLEAKLA